MKRQNMSIPPGNLLPVYRLFPNARQNGALGNDNYGNEQWSQAHS